MNVYSTFCDFHSMILWCLFENLFYTIVNSLRYVQYLVFHNSHLVMSIFYIWIIYVHVISNIVRCLFVDRLRLVQYLMMSILNACGLYFISCKVYSRSCFVNSVFIRDEVNALWCLFYNLVRYTLHVNLAMHVQRGCVIKAARSISQRCVNCL